MSYLLLIAMVATLAGYPAVTELGEYAVGRIRRTR